MHFAQPKFLGTRKVQIRRRRAREDVQTHIVYQCDDKISWTLFLQRDDIIVILI